MVEINKEIVEIVNKAGRIGTLGTANKLGQPNIAYFGSPQLSEEGTIVMGLGSNRTLKNLEENPLAVFFCIAESPVTFTTPGYRLYLKVREIQKEGPILDSQGNELGRHKGIPFYTIGQRKGLGIAATDPLYVTNINAEENVVYVGSKVDLYGDELTATDLKWIAFDQLNEPMQVQAKIRYRHTAADATVTPDGDGGVRVKFTQKQMSITPGQAVVFYDGDTVIGGGTIQC
jgi:hypothetical protein